MLLKMYLPFLMLCLGVFLTGCVDEGDIGNLSSADEIEFKSNTPPGPEPEGCDASFPPVCDCKFKINYVTDSQAEWSLRTYGAGGINGSCCINNNVVQNVNIGEACGTFGNYPIGQWANLPCGLNAGNFGLVFNSRKCFTSCEYDFNGIGITVSCTSNAGGTYARTFSIEANNNTDCEEQAGYFLTSVNAGNCTL